MKRVAIYLRVSTAAQAKRNREPEGYSIPTQREACLAKAAELGAEVVGEYADRGESAKTADRPQLQALIAEPFAALADPELPQRLDAAASNETAASSGGGSNEAVIVGATGFEPATFRPPAECATRLRHAPEATESSPACGRSNHEAREPGRRDMGLASTPCEAQTPCACPLGAWRWEPGLRCRRATFARRRASRGRRLL
jgi:Resolvase, N terminal domain